MSFLKAMSFIFLALERIGHLRSDSLTLFKMRVNESEAWLAKMNVGLLLGQHKAPDFHFFSLVE